MAIAFGAQAVNASPSSAATTHTASLTTSAGDLVVVLVGERDYTGVSGVSGSVNGAYTQAGTAVAEGAGETRAEIWYFENSGAGTETITVTFNGSTRAGINASRWTGAATSSALEDNGGATNASGTTHNSGSITFTGPGLIIEVGCLSAYWGDPDPPESSDGFTLMTTTGAEREAFFYKLSSGETTDGTFTTNGSVISSVKIASFIEAGGGGGGGEVSGTPVQSLESCFGPARAARLNGAFQ
jgi:hypothetical protein